MKMQDRVAIVTGAGYPRGLGRAIALALAGEGADLVAVDLNLDGAETIAEEIRSLGRRALAVKTDVTQEDQVAAMVKAVLEEFGRIDVLVNNAGVTSHTPFLEVRPEEWDWMLGVHLKGNFLCTKAVLPTMIEQRSGRIVSISSINGQRGGTNPNSSLHYSAAKAGIMGFAKHVARFGAQYGITSNVVAPGFIDTDFTRAFESPEGRAKRLGSIRAQVPLGRLGTPQDVAEAVLFLASDSASYITGEILAVNGGLHID